MPLLVGIFTFLLQAAVAWQWFNYCESQTPAGKAILKINMDETSISLFHGNGKGNVLLSKKHPRPVQRVPRGKTRACLTHVAFLCDQPEIQPLLPQIVIGNEATLPAGEMASLRAACPSNVRLVRQKSSWNNRFLCAIIVRILALALRPFRDRFQPVLLLDAVRLHFAQVVLNACNNCGIWLVLVPAKTTWLLQPLDTDAFNAFKRFLRRAYQNARAEAAVSDLSIGQFLQCLYQAIRCGLQSKSWASAFNKNGFGCHQAEVAEHVMRELGMEGPVQVSAARPSVHELECVFPRRTVIPAASLWRPFHPVAQVASPVSAAVHAPGSSSALPGAVLQLGRTRSEHIRAVAARAKAASPSAEAKAAVPVFARASRLPWPKAKATVEGE